MGDESTRAAALLREYLATRDIACDLCGYNLRGAQGVFCPECGAVIPRPPVEHTKRVRTAPADLKLWCWDCGYSVMGADIERCPECGGRKMSPFAGREPPPPPFRIPWMPRHLPLLLTANAAIGVTMTVMSATLAVQRWAGSAKVAGSAPMALVGGILCAAPIVIAGLWVWNWPRLRLIEHGPRRLLSTGAFVIGLGLVVAGLKVLG